MAIEKLSNQVSYETLFKSKLIGYQNFIGSNICAIWGAGAKGFTFLNILDKNASLIKYVVDINPKKQNKYIFQ